MGTARLALTTLLTLLLWGVPCTVPAQTRAPEREGKPRIARLDLRGSITIRDIQRDHFADFDLVVLSARLESEQPGVLNALQQANPHAHRLLIYSVADLWTDWRDHPREGYVFTMGEQVALRHLWLPTAGMSEPARGRDPVVNYWPRKHMTNVADPAWADTWPSVVARDLRTTESSQRGLLGVLADNAWDDVRWVENLPANVADGLRIDADRDGAADPPDSLKTWWKAGTHRTLHALRTALNERLIIANGPNTAYDAANGRMWENIGTETSITVENILTEAGKFRGGAPRMHIVHVTTDDLEFGLAVTLLRDDLYLAVSDDGMLHSSRVWDERFNLDLGEPLGDARRNGGIWTREYTQVTVRVNATERTGTVTPRQVD